MYLGVSIIGVHPNGWFIIYRIRLKWMIWRYPRLWKPAYNVCIYTYVYNVSFKSSPKVGQKEQSSKFMFESCNHNHQPGTAKDRL